MERIAGAIILAGLTFLLGLQLGQRDSRSSPRCGASGGLVRCADGDKPHGKCVPLSEESSIVYWRCR